MYLPGMPIERFERNFGSRRLHLRRVSLPELLEQVLPGNSGAHSAFHGFAHNRILQKITPSASQGWHRQRCGHNVAPGPDWVQGRVLAHALKELEFQLRAYLERGVFHFAEIWPPNPAQEVGAPYRLAVRVRSHSAVRRATCLVSHLCTEGPDKS